MALSDLEFRSLIRERHLLSPWWFTYMFVPALQLPATQKLYLEFFLHSITAIANVTRIHRVSPGHLFSRHSKNMGYFPPFSGAWCPASQSNRFESGGLHVRAFGNILDSQPGFFKQQVNSLFQLSPFLNPQLTFVFVDFDPYLIMTNELPRLILYDLDIFFAKSASVNINPS